MHERAAMRVLVRADDRIAQHGGVGPHVLGRKPQLLPQLGMLPQAAQACRQVAAGREAHHRNPVRIGMPLCRMAAHIGDGRRRVVLGQREGVFRRLVVPGRRVLPANLILRLRTHAVPEDEHVEALRQKAQRDRLGLPLAAKRIAAAGADDNRRALDPGIDLPGNARNIHIHANLGAARGRHKNAFVEHIDLLIVFSFCNNLHLNSDFANQTRFNRRLLRSLL